jgi:phage virion morphogenesis protein
MFEVKIDAKNALAGLAQMELGTRNLTPLARGISIEFLSHTEANFAAQGRPKWMGLSPTTISMRTKRGTWPGQILQVSAGGLASSLSTDHDATSATIGSNKKYAAMQQLGGITSPRSMIPGKVIPARPYLPMDAQGNLQPEAEEGIMRLANDYLASIGGR